ncbi:unnamed protein product [Linum trigynum]|uniref:CCHC-type domain-containing protein n=1 Tax=Linum trigynum TaxID=586398 RepID=A0AAV2D323_9ROSI
MEPINNEAITNQGRGSLVQSQTRGRGGRLVLSSTGGRGMSMLLGKMLTESKVAVAKAAGAARYAWGCYGEVNIQPTETQNLFLFTFKSREIRDKIWEERPWSLSNTMTAIEKYSGRGKPEDVPIEKMAMWVQIHGLHQNQRSEENMVAIGSSYFLELLDIDRASLEFIGYRRFLRILVEVDIREPVPVGFDFPFLDEFTGVEHCDEIEFKYERLVELCYFCGKVGHNWPTCRAMNEERRQKGVAYLSEIYTASLKAGIDSPRRSSAAQVRNRGEGRGSYRGNEAGESNSATERGSTAGGMQLIPPGFRIQRVEEGQIKTEDLGLLGRQRGRYREGMGGRDISVDLEKAAEELEWGLRLGEGGGGWEAGNQRRGVGLGQGSGEGEVQTALSLGLGPVIQETGGKAHGQLNKGGLEKAQGKEISGGSGLYQHVEEELEEEMGRARKKRKGTNRLELVGPIIYEGAVFMGGQEGKNRKKKGIRGKKGAQRVTRSEEVADCQEDDSRAAVVRQKPPHPE